MEIIGAVLERCGAPAPWADSRPLTVGPLELDPPGPGEITVRIEAAGLCHSDLSVVDGNRVRPTPMLLGHEAAGIVETVGDHLPADAGITVGARTVVGSYLGSAVPSRDIPRYVELWRAGRLPLERLVSARIGLDELPRALDRLAAGEELRQLITFDERTPA